MGKFVFDPDPIIRSTFRLAEFCRLMKEKPEKLTFQLIREESTILARRAIRFWFSLRFRR